MFLLFDVEGYRHQEIAKILGCSVGNSKSQVHKARKKLKRLLKLGRSKQVVTTPHNQPQAGPSFIESSRNPTTA